MDRPFPEPHPFDPDESGTGPRPEHDPDDQRDDDLECEFEERREARVLSGRWIRACIDQTGGRFPGF